jgi:hypothetical protein
MPAPIANRSGITLFLRAQESLRIQITGLIYTESLVVATSHTSPELKHVYCGIF